MEIETSVVSFDTTSQTVTPPHDKGGFLLYNDFIRNKHMTKCIRNGEVAILYSSGFGAGWSTWSSAHSEFMLHDEKLVELVESDQRDKIEEYVQSVYPDEYICCAGADRLEVKWVPVGTQFIIEEYDGSESIIFEHTRRWNRA